MVVNTVPPPPPPSRSTVMRNPPDAVLVEAMREVDEMTPGSPPIAPSIATGPTRTLRDFDVTIHGYHMDKDAVFVAKATGVSFATQDGTHWKLCADRQFEISGIVCVFQARIWDGDRCIGVLRFDRAATVDNVCLTLLAGSCEFPLALDGEEATT